MVVFRCAWSGVRRGPTGLVTGLKRALGRVWLDRPPPVSVAPRQIPPAIRGHRAGHQIKAARARRVAAAQSRQRDPPTGPQSKSCDRLVGIFGTRRQVPAMHANQRGERIAVERNHAPGRAPRRTAGRFNRPLEADGRSQVTRQQTRPRAWFQSGQWPTPRHRTSAGLRHGAPCNRAPALAPRYPPIYRSGALRFP